METEVDRENHDDRESWLRFNLESYEKIEESGEYIKDE